VEGREVGGEWVVRCERRGGGWSSAPNILEKTFICRWVWGGRGEGVVVFEI
jgi:hypothetical protein